MGFKDLQKWLNHVQNNTNSNASIINSTAAEENKEIQLQRKHFDIFLNKRFYISDIEEHKAEDIRTNEQSCFNHIIGLPKKNGQELKIFDYEMNLFDALQKHDDIWIKKARGLGITESQAIAKCGNIQDPLKVDEFNKVKHAERGQTIRSSSSSDDRPFAEMFNSNNTSTNNEKGPRMLKGTQVSRALSQTDIINNDPEPNEDSMLSGQNNMRILRTETTYPESGRKVVKTFDDDY